MSKKTSKNKKKPAAQAEVFWVIPMGNHMSLPLEPMPIEIAFKELWRYKARSLKQKLAEHVHSQLSMAEDIWRAAISCTEPNSLLSGCSYPQGRFLTTAQEVQELQIRQRDMELIEAMHRVDGLEWSGESVLDYTYRPDEKVLDWIPKYVNTITKSAQQIGVVHETKFEMIVVGDKHPWGKDFSGFIARLVSPLEVDGWKADVPKSMNHHKLKGENYEVIFRRTVPPVDWNSVKPKPKAKSQ